MPPVTALQSSSTWIAQLNKAWRSADLRQQFEKETGLKPLLVGNSLAVEEQASSGAAARYHYEFRIWVTKRLGLEDVAPEEIRGQLR